MKPLIPYLFFNGNCRDAMEFYKQCFGGDLEMCTYGDSPEDFGKKADKDEIMHAMLNKGKFSLMASDWAGGEAIKGNNVHLSIDCESKSEIEDLFKKLSSEGKVVQPLADTFWGSHFGMLVDKFGMHWMLNCPLQK